MDRLSSSLRNAALMPCFVMIAACGGGGGSNSTSNNAPPVSTAPTITSSSTATVTENIEGTAYDGTASDPQGDSISWDVFSGADAGLFSISSDGELSFQEPPNFDLPSDEDGDNIYEVTIRARAGGEQDTLAVRITVQNDREGVVVRRIATGLVSPLNLDWTGEDEQLFVAESGGRALYIDGKSGFITEDIFVRDFRRPGEVLGALWGWREELDNRFQRGAILITHQMGEGLALQAFDPEGRDSQFTIIGEEPAGPIKVAMYYENGLGIMAIGDPSGNRAQDSSSAYGKLYQIFATDPYSGASIPPPGLRNHTVQIIGDGIRSPGGISKANDHLALAEQGETAEHGITLFQSFWRPLDFGWPFWEGSTEVRADAPERINGPTLVYGLGTGRGEGDGPAAGFEFNGTSIPGIDGHYVFADVGGKIFSIPSSIAFDGRLHFGIDLEDRTLDFTPDSGSIDGIVAIARTETAIYMLDSDGDVFRLEGET